MVYLKIPVGNNGHEKKQGFHGLNFQQKNISKQFKYMRATCFLPVIVSLNSLSQVNKHTDTGDTFRSSSKYQILRLYAVCLK